FPAEELKFIRCRRFERGSAFTARLNEERPAVPRDGPFLWGVGAGINADVFLQNFWVDGDRFEGGNLERFTVVDVDYAADNVLDRVNLRVGGVGDHKLFFRLVSQPRPVVVAAAGVPVEGLAGEREGHHSEPLVV